MAAMLLWYAGDRQQFQILAKNAGLYPVNAGGSPLSTKTFVPGLGTTFLFYSGEKQQFQIVGKTAGVLPALGSSGPVASFSISPTGGHALGAAHITATGVGTTWTGSNPFSVTFGGSFASISNYVNISATSATFDLNITSDGGTVTISDSNSGTTQNYAAVAVVPNAPTNAVATAGDASAQVSFTESTDNGGSPITGHTATSTPGGLTGTGSSPITITGLTNGTAYTFTVHSTNAVGDSPESGSSNSVTPQAKTYSISPTSGHATGVIPITATGVGTSWGASNPFTVTGGGGFASISGYVNSNPTSATFNLVLSSLGGTVTIHDSSSNTDQTYSAAVVIPSVPTIGTLTDNHDGTITIVFTPSADTGGGTVTYKATTSSGGFNNSGPGSPITIAGVNKGVAQHVNVTATNSAGTSAASGNSNTITPITVPGPPTSLVATATTVGHATVAFTAPADNGGGSITGYTVTSIPAGGVDSNAGGTGLSHTITGLQNATAYTFTAVATNSFGTSAPSSPSNQITTLGFSLSPSSFNTTGVKHITATGFGTSWGGSNPFAIVSGPLSTLTNYVNLSPTSATFDVTVTAINGTPGVISDSNSGTNTNLSLNSSLVSLGGCIKLGAGRFLDAIELTG